MNEPERPWNSFGEALGLIHHKSGIEGVKAVLAMEQDANARDREWLFEAGDELEAAGLLSAARVVFSYAASRPSYYDRPDHDGSSDPHWRAQQDRFRKWWEARRARWREARGLK